MWRIDLGLIALAAGIALLAARFWWMAGLGVGRVGLIVVQTLGTLCLVFAGQALIANLLVCTGRLGRHEGVYMRQRLDRGECAACGFSLDAIPDDTDGCRVCPECGAARGLSISSGDDGHARARRSRSVVPDRHG